MPQFGDGLNRPRIDTVLDRTDSGYAAVIAASKRSRQLAAYFVGLAEGQPTPVELGPRVQTASRATLSIALHEIAAGEIRITDPTPAS
jgi:DNA-directed RNA polymerase subunit omega